MFLDSLVQRFDAVLVSGGDDGDRGDGLVDPVDFKVVDQAAVRSALGQPWAVNILVEAEAVVGRVPLDEGGGGLVVELAGRLHLVQDVEAAAFKGQNAISCKVGIVEHDDPPGWAHRHQSKDHKINLKMEEKNEA